MALHKIISGRTYSWWEKDTFFKERDIVIVGAGLVGLSTAISIKERNPNADILIVERESLPYGASTRNAGFACFGSASEILDDLKNDSEDTVKSLIKRRWKGLLKLRERIGDTKLQYVGHGGYELFKEEDSSTYNSCIESVEFLNDLIDKTCALKNTFEIRKNQLGFNAKDNLIFNKHEGQLHPGELMHALLELATKYKVDFLNSTSVEKFEKEGDSTRLYLSGGNELICNQLVICTNAFTNELVPDLDIKPGRNQVLMTKPIKGLSLKACFHYNKGYVYFRNYENRLLIGGGRNTDQNENTDAFGLTENIQNYLRELLRNVILPNLEFEEDTWWSGIIATGNSKEPLIRQLDDNIFMGVRSGGMGVALGSLIGEELAEMIL